jgi:hypothetical protein
LLPKAVVVVAALNLASINKTSLWSGKDLESTGVRLNYIHMKGE